ncbi:MAG: hypothetical protein A4S09_13375 [Proteobacteria bacterium SG_bin7]|nr:MAG: hypothetical protein A4S09_13375 [Proteobacteria bacterium SG_bin7]
MEIEKISYFEAKALAAKMDIALGFQISEIENQIKKINGLNSWAGLDQEVLQTPYVELHEIMEQLDLRDGSLIVDVGAAYGRLGHVIGRSFPNLHFLGFEVVLERVLEGNRVLKNFNYSNVSLRHADVADKNFSLPVAEAYFIYDFGSPDHVRKVLNDIGEISKTKAVSVVGRGRLSRDLIERENPWLSQVAYPWHFKNFSIYRTLLA